MRMFTFLCHLKAQTISLTSSALIGMRGVADPPTNANPNPHPPPNTVKQPSCLWHGAHFY
jgi:hypothetical protein